MLNNKYRKNLIILIAIILIGAVFTPIITGNNNEYYKINNYSREQNLAVYDVTIIDDYSYPGYEDFDYGLGYSDIHIDNDYSKNGVITILN